MAQANLYIEEKNQEYILAKQKIKKFSEPLYYICYLIIGYGVLTLFRNIFTWMSMSTWTDVQFHVYSFDPEKEVEPIPHESGGFMFVLCQILISCTLGLIGFRGIQTLKPEVLSHSYLTKS
mmetsp:Transcript_12562/g.12362  ORF Transcript_12562/g.12362 Transcript_12562/m.12362 type:complete len:121 (+) Transcript_12562:177-539(+)